MTAMPGLLVNIDAPDLANAVRFYTTALGLEVARHLGPDIAELRGAPSPIYLTQRTEAAPRTYERHWTPVHLAFVWGRYRVLADPFGHGFCLLQFKKGGYANIESEPNA